MTEQIMENTNTEPFGGRLNNDEVLYSNRQSWFRYAFYISTTALFVAVFWWMLASRMLAGGPWDAAAVVNIAGALVAPLLPALYYTRWRNSGYAVTRSAVWVKEGFFMSRVVEIPLEEIESAERLREKKELPIDAGHARITLKDGSTRMQLDLQDPDRFVAHIRRQLRRLRTQDCHPPYAKY